MCKPKKIYVLDRFEGGQAVMVSDEGGQINAPGVQGREGDLFELIDGTFVPREEEKQAREARVRAKMDGLFGKRGEK